MATGLLLKSNADILMIHLTKKQIFSLSAQAGLTTGDGTPTNWVTFNVGPANYDHDIEDKLLNFVKLLNIEITADHSKPIPKKPLNHNSFHSLPDSAIFDTSEAAEFLGLSIQTLQVWRRTGRYDLPYCKIGRNVRYRLRDLRQFLQDRMKTHTGQNNG
jgi:hypothetical protein